MREDNSRPQKCLTSTYLTISRENGDPKSTQKCVHKTTLGDLYVLGKLWIDVLQTGLLGCKWKIPPLIPTVNAAAPPPPPQKPPKMKYTDLPLYTSPHNDYQVYKEDAKMAQCPDAKRKVLHEKIYPRVKAYRKEISQNYKDVVAEFISMKKEATASIRAKIKEKVSYMRSPDNLTQRQACVGVGALTGYILSRKYSLVTPKLFYTTAGVLATGALCFPEETDEAVRTAGYYGTNLCIWMYNGFCNKGYSLRQRMPCSSDLPGPLPARTPNKCPEN